MKTFDGYKKRNLTDKDYALLAGGGHKALDTLFSALSSDTTNAIKITVGGTEKSISTSTLKTSLGLGSNAYTSTAYLPLAGGTMALGEGLKFHSDDNYFGTNEDARIISLLDNNDTICDGGLIIDERATYLGTEHITELLRIRDSEFKWKGNVIWHAGNDGSGSGLDADLLDGIHASKFPYINNSGVWKVYGNSAAAALADYTAGLSAWAFGETRNLERTYLGILKPSASTCGISAYGTIVVFGQGDTHLGIASDYSGANLQVFGGNADKIIWRKKVAFTDGTGASGTWGINISGNAATATKASYLPTKYDGGDKPNPQYYFNQDIGVRVAMTRYATIGGTTAWFDTLWINGYAGNDVPNMVALTTIRNGSPRAFLSTQSNRSTTYGTYYEIISSYNIGSQSVKYATSAGNADTLDGYHASAFATASHTHNNIKGPDNRSINNNPLWFMSNKGSASLSVEFSTLGTSILGGNYTNLLTSTSWNNSSGGRPVLIATGNAGLTIRTSKSDTEWNTWASGNIYAGNFYTASDVRYKHITLYLNINIKLLALIPIFNFIWTDILDDKEHTGTSAQEVLKILPNIVTESEKLTVDYATLGTIAGITACKELVNLKSEIEKLKEKISILELKLSKYESPI